MREANDLDQLLARKRELQRLDSLVRAGDAYLVRDTATAKLYASRLRKLDEALSVLRRDERGDKEAAADGEARIARAASRYRDVTALVGVIVVCAIGVLVAGVHMAAAGAALLAATPGIWALGRTLLIDERAISVDGEVVRLNRQEPARLARKKWMHAAALLSRGETKVLNEAPLAIPDVVVARRSQLLTEDRRTQRIVELGADEASAVMPELARLLVADVQMATRASFRHKASLAKNGFSGWGPLGWVRRVTFGFGVVVAGAAVVAAIVGSRPVAFGLGATVSAVFVARAALSERFLRRRERLVWWLRARGAQHELLADVDKLVRKKMAQVVELMEVPVPTLQPTNGLRLDIWINQELVVIQEQIDRIAAAVGIIDLTAAAQEMSQELSVS